MYDQIFRKKNNYSLLLKIESQAEEHEKGSRA